MIFLFYILYMFSRRYCAIIPPQYQSNESVLVFVVTQCYVLNIFLSGLFHCYRMFVLVCIHSTIRLLLDITQTVSVSSITYKNKLYQAYVYEKYLSLYTSFSKNINLVVEKRIYNSELLFI